MLRRIVTQILRMVLAISLVAGLSTSAVSMGGGLPTKPAMAGMTAMSSDMGGSSHRNCGDCPTKAGDAAKAMVCGSLCSAPVMAMSPAIAPVALVEIRGSFAIVQSRRLGALSAPDPYPPRPFNIA